MGINESLQVLILGQSDEVGNPLLLAVLVDVRAPEGGVAARLGSKIDGEAPGWLPVNLSENTGISPSSSISARIFAWHGTSPPSLRSR
jgi:hypothetical protein